MTHERCAVRGRTCACMRTMTLKQEQSLCSCTGSCFRSADLTLQKQVPAPASQNRIRPASPHRRFMFPGEAIIGSRAREIRLLRLLHHHIGARPHDLRDRHSPGVSARKKAQAIQPRQQPSQLCLPRCPHLPALRNQPSSLAVCKAPSRNCFSDLASLGRKSNLLQAAEVQN